MSESALKGADSPLSLWVFKLSKRLHFGKINGIRGTRGLFMSRLSASLLLLASLSLPLMMKSSQLSFLT